MSSKSYNMAPINYGSIKNAQPDESFKTAERDGPAIGSDQSTVNTRPTSDSTNSSTLGPTANPPRPAVRQRYSKGNVNKAFTDAQDEEHYSKPRGAPAEPSRDVTGLVSIDGPSKKLSNTPDVMPTNSDSTLHAHPEQIKAKNTVSLPLPTELTPVSPDDLPPTRPYPKKVLFIVANEFCERFSYYGLRTVLILYFTNVLSYSDANATVIFHLFVTLCYLTPILGAILADSVWGKFKTIFYLSIVYFIGEAILVAASIFWNLNTFSSFITFLGLFFIGLGTGGIKPCVSALGGDQFLPGEGKWLQTFFSVFYAAINLGSLISMALTPILRADFSCVNRNDCYPYAFGLPCLLMFVSIVIFLIGKNDYVESPLPEENVILAFCKCVWLALRRKISGFELDGTKRQMSSSDRLASSQDNSSSSNISVSSNEDGAAMAKKNPENLKSDQTNSKKRDHWLYLASDRFSSKSIEDFRQVLSILLLFIPIPAYWCLYDQQSSLWTLQATRMDGHLFGSKVAIQPDQITVANPLLLVAAIPIFEMLIYPSFRKVGMLKRPVERMTVGGILAALSFCSSAIIEMRIQEYHPASLPPVGMSNLILINGLSDCSIIDPTLNYNQVPFMSNSSQLPPLDPVILKSLNPLMHQQVSLNSTEDQFNNLQLRFKLSGNPKRNTSCPLNTDIEHSLSFLPPSSQDVQMAYIDQGNGKLMLKVFNDSLEVPGPGKTRVRLVYQFFGSLGQAEQQQFSLSKIHSDGSLSNNLKHIKFETNIGQVLVSEYLDLDVPFGGADYQLVTNDSMLSASLNQTSIRLDSGTRNLIVLSQNDLDSIDISHNLLQDNKYRISILYQLIPYLLISVSEVMFSITGLEFSYSMAPDSMKSLILGAWSLTTALGNTMTVAFESMHIFANVTHDILFYAILMTLDMLLFALLGAYYSPKPMVKGNK